MASWAETEIPLAADLLAGDQDPRSSVAGLLGRALAALPQAIRDGAAAAGRTIALRADAGYFAGQLARAAAAENMAFAIGAKRITSMWKALAGIAEDAWRDATGMPNAQVAVSPYKPADWPEDTVLLVRRVKLDPDQVSADPRSRRRRTLHPDQRALPIPELEQEPVIYAYCFICTNLDCSTPARAAAVEHWYRHRTSIENIFRDSKHGAALRHLPSGHEQVNTAWMWASLIAAAIAAWCHQLTGVILGGELVEGHGVRGGKAMIATLRRRLIAMPARLVSHGGQLIMRLAPGPCLLPQVLAAIRALPAPPASPASRHHPRPPCRHRHAIPRTRPPRPRTSRKAPNPRTRRDTGSSSCPPTARHHLKINYPAVDNVRRSTCGFGSEEQRTRVLADLRRRFTASCVAGPGAGGSAERSPSWTGCARPTRALITGFLARSPDGGWLPQASAAELLSSYGIPLVATIAEASEEEAAAAAAQLGGPVVLKAEAEGLMHRTDDGASAHHRGDYDEAGRHYLDALNIVERLGDQAKGPPATTVSACSPVTAGTTRRPPGSTSAPWTSASGSATRPAGPPATTISACSPKTAGDYD